MQYSQFSPPNLSVTRACCKAAQPLALANFRAGAEALWQPCSGPQTPRPHCLRPRCFTEPSSGGFCHCQTKPELAPCPHRHL